MTLLYFFYSVTCNYTRTNNSIITHSKITSFTSKYFSKRITFSPYKRSYPIPLKYSYPCLLENDYLS